MQRLLLTPEGAIANMTETSWLYPMYVQTIELGPIPLVDFQIALIASGKITTLEDSLVLDGGQLCSYSVNVNQQVKNACIQYVS